MKKLSLLTIFVLTIPLFAVPPRPQIIVLNPRCFPTNRPTQLEVYGQQLGGKLSLVVNGKEVPTTIDPANPNHLLTTNTFTFPGPGYVYVQIRAQYGGNVLYSTPLAWSYVVGPIPGLPNGTVGQQYSQDLNTIPLPSVCNFRNKPWYLES